MTKHPAARRVHRAAANEDAFLAGVLESSSWARDHARQLVTVVVLAAVLIVAAIFIRNGRVRTREAAAVELDRVRGTVQAGNVQVAKQDLQRFINSYGNTPSGAEAKLLMGQVQLEAGEAQNAITTLKPLANDVESSMGYNAALMLASAYELDKQNPDADRTYLRIADQARFDYQTREALDRAARLRADNGNTAGAIELYERIVATFDKDNLETLPERNAYEMRLSELRVQQGAPAGRS